MKDKTFNAVSEMQLATGATVDTHCCSAPLRLYSAPFEHFCSFLTDMWLIVLDIDFSSYNRSHLARVIVFRSQQFLHCKLTGSCRCSFSVSMKLYLRGVNGQDMRTTCDANK